MKELRNERIAHLLMLCCSVSIATLSIIGALNGTPVLWWFGITLLVLIPFQIYMASKPDSFHESNIEKTDKWIKRHPLMFLFIVVASLALSILDFF